MGVVLVGDYIEYIFIFELLSSGDVTDRYYDDDICVGSDKYARHSWIPFVFILPAILFVLIHVPSYER